MEATLPHATIPGKASMNVIKGVLTAVLFFYLLLRYFNFVPTILIFLFGWPRNFNWFPNK